jgi:hypothetical protein
MSQITLGQMLEKLSSLEPVELQQLGHAVQDQLVHQLAISQPSVNAKEALHQSMIDSGLLRPRKASQKSSQPTVRRLVQVQGEPVSQTIIEERR